MSPHMKFPHNLMSPRILIASALMLALLAAPAQAAPVQAVPAQARQTTSAPTPVQDYQSKTFVATSQVRALHDLARLRPNDCVQHFAVRQAKRMAAQDRMFHQDLRPILTRCGLHMVAENVAYGYATGIQVVLQGWMRSPGHRANILGRSYRLLGTGARRSEDGTWYAAQVFGRKA